MLGVNKTWPYVILQHSLIGCKDKEEKNRKLQRQAGFLIAAGSTATQNCHCSPLIMYVEHISLIHSGWCCNCTRPNEKDKLGMNQSGCKSCFSWPCAPEGDISGMQPCHWQYCKVPQSKWATGPAPRNKEALWKWHRSLCCLMISWSTRFPLAAVNDYCVANTVSILHASVKGWN